MHVGRGGSNQVIRSLHSGVRQAVFVVVVVVVVVVVLINFLFCIGV